MRERWTVLDQSPAVRWWVRAGLGSVGVVIVWFLAVDVLWADGPTLAFAGGVFTVLGTVLIVLWWAISGVDSGDRVRVTTASWLTIARGASLAVLGGFLVSGPLTGMLAWIPVICFAIAAGLDAVDGLVARVTDSVTSLGTVLDREIDSLVVLIGAAFVVSVGSAPTIYLLVGVARYLFGMGVWARRIREAPVYDLPARLSRRVLGASQLLVIAIALLPITTPSSTRPLAFVAMIPFLLGFVRDWMLITGRK